MSMSNLIKQLAVGAVDAKGYSPFMVAEITSLSPLKVKLNGNQKLIIPEQLLIVPKRLKEQEPLNIGDKVMIASMSGGQSFFVIDPI